MLIEYSFFQYALIGGLFAALLCGLIGTYIVTRRMVIVGGGMAHASLGGVGLGAYFGFSPILGAAGFSLLSGFAVEYLAKRRIREDSAIAMLWTLGMSVGILFSYLTPGFMNDLSTYLFGDILAISGLDLGLIFVLALVAWAFYYVFRIAVITLSYDRDFAITQGVPVVWIEKIMLALTALSIVVCLRMVGIMLVVALLSIPQQTAALFTHRFHKMVWFSVLFGYVGIVLGLLGSYYVNVPSGASIIIVYIVMYGLMRWVRRCI